MFLDEFSLSFSFFDKTRKILSACLKTLSGSSQLRTIKTEMVQIVEIIQDLALT